LLLRPVILDAAMTAAEALERLAANGLWASPSDPAPETRILRHASRLSIPVSEATALLTNPVDDFGIAIRQLRGERVVWHSLTTVFVLDRCRQAAPDRLLVATLELDKSDAQPWIDASDGRMVDRAGVVFVDGELVGVNVPGPPTPGAALRTFENLGLSRLSSALPPSRSRAVTDEGRTTVDPSLGLELWPRVDAPARVTDSQVFTVTVGVSPTREQELNDQPLLINPPLAGDAVVLTVELTLEAADAPQGWSKEIVVSPKSASSVAFDVVARLPSRAGDIHLTTIEVRYVRGGTVCGAASRPLVIARASDASGAPTPNRADARESSGSTSRISLAGEDRPPDLTIEFLKPDQNPANGYYVCRLISPHCLTTNPGPHDVNLGMDAKTFARQVIDDIYQFSAHSLEQAALDGYALLIKDALPDSVFDAIREVATFVAPEPPAILIVSADPYVPWELARLEPALDNSRPPYLGTQVLLGRWLRTRSDRRGPASARPPLTPPSRLDVSTMAVFATRYQPPSGLARLFKAEQEADALTESCGAVRVEATAEAVQQMLDARLDIGYSGPSGVEAIHFAGHGNFDTTQPDNSAIFLSDGLPLKSILFRSAKYGGRCQPLMFLNACMSGIGGELLGDMGGFPGHCLRGGFGALIGALWAIDDDISFNVALEFWRRALPANGTDSEPIGSIMRDARSRLDPSAITTRLSYVYYGHPRLVLRRVLPFDGEAAGS
jgi:Ternary complex associated domain 7/CHAT domain